MCVCCAVEITFVCLVKSYGMAVFTLQRSGDDDSCFWHYIVEAGLGQWTQAWWSPHSHRYTILERTQTIYLYLDIHAWIFAYCKCACIFVFYSFREHIRSVAALFNFLLQVYGLSATENWNVHICAGLNQFYYSLKREIRFLNAYDFLLKTI